MFCSCSRLPAIREVVFKDMLRMRSSTFRVFRACEEASGERGALKTFLWHAVFLQRNLRTLTMSVSGWPAISSPCRSDEEPKFFPFPLSLYHWFLFTNWYSTCLISDICPFSISLQYHNPITATWMENRYSAYTYLYINILQIKTNNKHQIPISANHSIILCKNGYKIGKTEWFSFSGTVL